MEAARMAESRIPQIRAGKIVRTILINTRDFVSAFSTSPSSRCPMQPAATENRMIRMFQAIPIFALLRRSLLLRTDMNRIMIWGIPK